MFDDSQADVQIGKMSVKVHGSILSWIYDLLFAIFKSSIKKDIDTSIDKVLQVSSILDWSFCVFFRRTCKPVLFTLHSGISNILFICFTNSTHRLFLQ